VSSVAGGKKPRSTASRASSRARSTLASLRDGEHKGVQAGAATFASGDTMLRPATTVGNNRAGVVRLATVELKRSPSSSPPVFPTEHGAAGVLLDNARVRAWRVSHAPGESAPLLQGPAVRVFVTAGAISENGRRAAVGSGQTAWTPHKRRSTIVNAGDAQLTFVDVLLR
jgi:hypothetical protein